MNAINAAPGAAPGAAPDGMRVNEDRFALRTTLTSPFGRKVRMAAEVLGLTDRIQIVPADTADEADSLRRQNPLGKIPCLVCADGTPIYDSGVIVEFLQAVAGTDRLLPSGAGRFPVLVAARLADGIIEAAVLLIYEARFHEPGASSDRWLALQRGKVERGLQAFEAAPPDPRRTDAAAIGLACLLEFLDRRKPVPWRPACPGLAAWLTAFAEHEPAYTRTLPPPAA